MLKLKTIGTFILALCAIPLVHAQDIKQGQNYEIRTVSGLALDNQGSLRSGSGIYISKPV